MFLFDMLFVACLGSEDFETRRIATTYLHNRGKAIVGVLSAGKRSKDVEVRHTCKVLYCDISEQVASDFIKAHQPLPMLDSMWLRPDRTYDGYYNVEYRRAYERFAYILTLEIKYEPSEVERDTWGMYYAATELAIRDIFYTGDEEEIAWFTGLLDEMYRRDTEVWYGSPEKVPVNRKRK